MKRFGQIIGLNPDDLDRYAEYHRNVWPEVLEKIKECNITNYSIYHFEGKLFAYFEYTGTDFESDMKKMANHKKTQDWWSLMGPMQIPEKNRKEGEWWAEMEELFHLD